MIVLNVLNPNPAASMTYGLGDWKDLLWRVIIRLQSFLRPLVELDSWLWKRSS